MDPKISTPAAVARAEDQHERSIRVASDSSPSTLVQEMRRRADMLSRNYGIEGLVAHDIHRWADAVSALQQERDRLRDGRDLEKHMRKDAEDRVTALEERAESAEQERDRLKAELVNMKPLRISFSNVTTCDESPMLPAPSGMPAWMSEGHREQLQARSDALDARLQQIQGAGQVLVKALADRHYGRMPTEVQTAFDALSALLTPAIPHQDEKG